MMNVQQGGGGGGGDGGGGGGGGGVNNQPQLQPLPHQQPPPPQRCPRCDSGNTKFCYYNNYSLSQPRYFCKTCKRYWTHGGSLRNIPIGGGCRKGKRGKATAAAAAPSSSAAALQLMNQPQVQLQQPRLQEVIPTQPNPMMMMSPPRVLVGVRSSAVAAPAPAVPPMSSYYQQGGGFSSSLAAIQSLNPLSQPLFDLSSLNLGPSNLGLHPWFNTPSTTTKTTHQASKPHIPLPAPPAVVLQSAPDHQGLVQTSMMMNNMGNSSFASLTNDDWSQNPLWSTVSTTSIGDNSGNSGNNNDDDNGNDDDNAKAGSSSSLSGNQWPEDLPGFGPPP